MINTRKFGVGVIERVTSGSFPRTENKSTRYLFGLYSVMVER